MKLKILSTIVAISATATSASSLTCGDVQALYQDGACCSANSQSCVKSLSIATGSELNLTTNGELSIDLSGKEDKFPLTEDISLQSSVNFYKMHAGDSLRTQQHFVAENGLQSNANIDVYGQAIFKGDFYVQDSNNQNIMKIAPEHGDYGIVADKQVLLRQGANGKTLRVQNGIIEFNSATTVNFAGVVNSNNALEFTSDSRIKKDIVDADIEDALQKVLDIELKEYGYTDPIKEGEKTVGFIAQQVKEVYPDAIRVSDSEEDIWNEAGEKVQISDLHRIKKDKIYALHHGAIQSLVAKIAALEARLAALEAQPTA